MPFVRRNTQGQIDSLHRTQASDASEFLDDQHPDVQAFIGGPPAAFNRLDADFVRVIEDVIDTLIVKNVFNITDLPPQAQAKLFARKSFRDRITMHALKLTGEVDFDEVISDTSFSDGLPDSKYGEVKAS